MNAFTTGVDPILPAAMRVQPGIGAEEEMVQRAALLQIKTHLPEEVSWQEDLWAQRDEAFAKAMGWGFTPVQIEQPAPGNFYAGARPSLVEAPIEFWPSITVRANSSSSASRQLDQMDISDVPLFIEILCKAGPVPQDKIHAKEGVETDGMVDAQVQRLTAAVIGCIDRDKTLGGVVPVIARPARIKPSAPFTRPGASGQGTGDYYVFQGKQLEYVTTRTSY
jgi:hypothetical protein